MKAAEATETGGSHHLTLPFAAPSVADARHALEKWLRECGCGPDFIDDCRLVLSELVGNSVRHARPLPTGTMDVAWSCDGDGLVVAVTDGGSQTAPQRRDVQQSAVAGRGLAVVEALAARWWVGAGHGHTTVRARLAPT